MEDSLVTPAKPMVMFSRSKSYPVSFPQIHQLTAKSIEDAVWRVEASEEDLFESVKNESRSIFVFSVYDHEELTAVLNFLPHLKQQIKERKILVAVFVKVSSEKIDELLRRAGCYEVLKYDLSAKAFLYKLRRYMMHIRTVGDLELGNLELVEKVVKSKDIGYGDQSQDVRVLASKKDSTQKKGVFVHMVDPVNCPHDFWLFRKKVYAKKHKEFWMIELIGPSLAAGKWVLTDEFKSLYPDSPQVWKWVSRDTTGKFGSTFETHPNVWVFAGKCPEYSWVVNRWAFLSRVPELGQITAGMVHAKRFSLNEDGDLLVANNSEMGASLFKKIKSTFDKDWYLELEKLDQKSFGLVRDEDAKIPWADSLNSKDIPSEWNQSNLVNGDSIEWNDDSADSMPTKKVKRSLEENLDDLDIPLGAEAMKNCGLHATLKGAEVELLGYSEAERYLLLGLTEGSVLEAQTIELDIHSENFKEILKFSLMGVIESIELDQSGRMLVKVLIHSDSKSKIKKIREAIERRQEEIFLFFNKTKGLA